MKRITENGGTPQCEEAVVKSLRWLKKQHNKDGSWGGAPHNLSLIHILAVTNIVRNISALLIMVISAFATTAGALISNQIGAGEPVSYTHLSLARTSSGESQGTRSAGSSARRHRVGEYARKAITILVGNRGKPRLISLSLIHI